MREEKKRKHKKNAVMGLNRGREMAGERYWQRLREAGRMGKEGEQRAQAKSL